MKLSEHLKKEELQRLEIAWRALNPLQRKSLKLYVAVGSMGQRSLSALDQYIARRRARFVYWYPAHWMQRNLK